MSKNAAGRHCPKVNFFLTCWDRTLKFAFQSGNCILNMEQALFLNSSPRCCPFLPPGDPNNHLSRESILASAVFLDTSYATLLYTRSLPSSSFPLSIHFKHPWIQFIGASQKAHNRAATHNRNRSSSFSIQCCIRTQYKNG